jgi:predicted ATPase
MGLHSARERREILREIRMRRDPEAAALVRELRLMDDTDDEALGHAARVPAVAALRAGRAGLALDPQVTFLVGENGSGKSTLVEAIAVACGLNAEGGGRHMRHATRASHSPLGDHLRVTRGTRRPRTEFFLRAESVFTVATALDDLAQGDAGALDAYGGTSLHEVSHGESFLAILLHRFGPDGFYVLDEPEAALSPQNQLTLLRRMAGLVREGSQFVVATHSPILLAYPGATILCCDADGLHPVAYDEAPPVTLTRTFLADPQRVVDALLADDPSDVD